MYEEVVTSGKNLANHLARHVSKPEVACGMTIGQPFVVQAQCRDTARALGLLDRGVLAPGYKADVNVIDFDNLRLSAPEMRFDLPAGGRRLLQRADGYLHTVVSGIPVYESGRATGELPGQLVRGAQRRPTG